MRHALQIVLWQDLDYLDVKLDYFHPRLIRKKTLRLGFSIQLHNLPQEIILKVENKSLETFARFHKSLQPAWGKNK